MNKQITDAPAVADVDFDMQVERESPPPAEIPQGGEPQGGEARQ